MHIKQALTKNSNLIQVNKLESGAIKVLFLGLNKNETRLIDALIKNGCEVWHTKEKIFSRADFDLVVSFGYRHILKKEIIEESNSPIVNLHISYLPYNRGAHPNFWSFFDGTPSGVSIHLIDEGIDTGPILFQKYVNFKKEEKTFEQTYARLIREIEDLFIENINSIIAKTFKVIPQQGAGTIHKVADLPKEFEGWHANIVDEIKRLHLIRKNKSFSESKE